MIKSNLSPLTAKVVNKLNHQNEKDTPTEEYNLKLDLRTASYEEIMETWSNESTQYDGQEGPYKLYSDGMLYNVLKDYFGEEFVVDIKEVAK